jgi:hypothetical protein
LRLLTKKRVSPLAEIEGWGPISHEFASVRHQEIDRSPPRFFRATENEIIFFRLPIYN